MTERAPADAIQPTPWYRNRWFWLVATPPVAAVIGGLVTVVIAVRNADSLVVDNYAHIGQTFAVDQSRDQRARQLGVTATLRLDRADGVVELTVRGVPAQALELKLIHPTDAAGDRRLSLDPDAQGHYAGRLGRFDAFRREVEIASPGQGWRLRGELPAGTTQAHLAPS
ncbi:FixH family protein [Immundisolibacter sp.]